MEVLISAEAVTASNDIIIGSPQDIYFGNSYVSANRYDFIALPFSALANIKSSDRFLNLSGDDTKYLLSYKSDSDKE